jgi:hypothetical protein
MVDEREKMSRDLIFAAAQLRNLLEEQNVQVVEQHGPEMDPWPEHDAEPELIDLAGPPLPPGLQADLSESMDTA